MSSVVFLFGNGLSIGVAPEFAVRDMTARLNAELDADLRARLTELIRLSRPDTALPLEAVLGFEQLAGPLDRVANAVSAIAPLAKSAPDSDCLSQAHDFLRTRYLQLVGLVLRDVAATAKLGSGANWAEMNEFAVALRQLHQTHSVGLFTLSYDTLLDSALLEARYGWFYDGFAGTDLVLNQPLDCWPSTMPLYHLHGSVLWFEDPTGTIRKVRSDHPLHDELVSAWVVGSDHLGFPVVVLTDAKIPAVARHPIGLFYQELWRELAGTRVLVIAGYSFGDEPINNVIRKWMSTPFGSGQTLEVWTHAPDRARARFEERIADIGGLSGQTRHVEFRDVTLPSSAAVRDLEGRLTQHST